MKTRTNKFLCLALVMLMLLGMFSGCASSKTPAAPDDSKQGETKPVASTTENDTLTIALPKDVGPINAHN